jgi:hypothetical protein
MVYRLKRNTGIDLKETLVRIWSPPVLYSAISIVPNDTYNHTRAVRPHPLSNHDEAVVLVCQQVRSEMGR